MVEKNKGGKPTKYRQQYAEEAYKLCLLGAIDDELADFFKVCTTTIDTWKLKYPSFKAALRNGKKIADAKVAHALYNRAIGYEHASEEIFHHQGDIKRVQTTKRYAPDTTAGIFWLKNRNMQNWREKQEIEVVEVVLTPKERKVRITELLAKCPK